MSTQTLFIPGPLPGLNEILAAAKEGRGKHNSYGRMKEKWDKRIVGHIRIQGIKPISNGRFGFLWIEKERRRDPDNIAAGKKFILDALVTAGVLPSDGPKNVLGFIGDDFKIAEGEQRPGVIVKIEELQLRLL